MVCVRAICFNGLAHARQSDLVIINWVRRKYGYTDKRVAMSHKLEIENKKTDCRLMPSNSSKKVKAK
jgi:hypothetical protein